MIDSKILQREINSELDLILDDFEGQFDLIDFDKEKFIPIDHDLIKSFDFENFNDSDYILTNISKDDFNLKFDELYDNYQSHIEKYSVSNVYISVGLIEFDDYLAPAVLIPVFMEKNQNNYKIRRNFNQEIQFNGILKFILDEENVEFPKFGGDIHNFIKQFVILDEIKYFPEAYLCNFDLKFQHLLYDLDVNKWDLIEDKYQLFKENRDEFVKVEKDIFKNNLQKNADSLGIKDDVLHLKSFVSMGNSVLVVADVSTREKIKNSFMKDNFESLVLELSENLSKNDFYEMILNSEIIPSEDIVELDNLVKKHKNYSKLLHLINANYSTFNISPKEIKTRKDNFTQIIQDFNLDNFIFEIDDVKNYNEEFCMEMIGQIKEIYSFGEDIFNLQNHFSLDYLNSDDFTNLVEISKSIKKHLNYFSGYNKKLHEDYQIKIFEDVFSVNLLKNMVVLDRNPVLIENNDLDFLNRFLENYDDVEDIGDSNLQKYFQSDENIVKSIDINLKYTELIKYGILPVDSIEFILDDFDKVLMLCKHLIDVSYYVIKELSYIIDFYNSFDLFEIDSDLLKIDGDFYNIKKLINNFEIDIEKLVDFKKNYISFNILNMDVKNFIKFAFDNKFKENQIEPVFWFNVYNCLLNNFLNDYNQIDENKILGRYESEFDEINGKLVCDKEQLLVQHIYSKPLELNNNEKAIHQKENLINIRDNGDVGQIKSILTKYKDFIIANNRIFLIDMGLVSQVLDESYENHFDYVIITQDFHYDLDRLSLLLRSKNKLIKV